MNRRIIFIIIAVLATLTIGGGVWGYWYSQRDERAAELQQSERELATAAFFQSTSGKLVITSTPLNERLPNRPVVAVAMDSASQIDFTSQAGIISEPYLTNNVLTWYRFGNQAGSNNESGKLFKHENDTVTEIATVTHVPTILNPEAGVGIAISPTGTMLAWISEKDGLPVIVSYTLADNSERIMLTGELGETWSDLVWSPTGNELAMLNADGDILSFTTEGAEVYADIEFTEYQMNALQWIEPDTLAGVITSRTEVANPIDPTLAVVNRNGEIIERHTFIDKVGIPRVVWSPDKRMFAYYNPWRNEFVISDRFDVVQGMVTSTTGGQLQPVSWLPGNLPPKSSIDFDFLNNLNLNTNENTNTNEPVFEASAAEWDSYNQMTRVILEQFAVDFSTYRFAVTEQGIDIGITVLPEQQQVEKAFVQTLTQAMFTMPSVPAMSLRFTLSETNELAVANISRETIQNAVNQYTTVSLEDLFTVTKKKPSGVPTPKQDKPEHNYLSDLVYTTFGGYSPNSVLAYMSVQRTSSSELDDITWSSLWNDTYSLYYPSNWLVKDMAASAGEPYRAGDVVLYTTSTDFLSPSSWEGLAVEVRSYDVPSDVTLDQWLSVNRLDRTYTPTTFSLAANTEGKEFVSESAIEVVAKAGDRIFTLNLGNNQPLTDADKASLKVMAESLSSTAVFNR